MKTSVAFARKRPVALTAGRDSLPRRAAATGQHCGTALQRASRQSVDWTSGGEPPLAPRGITSEGLTTEPADIRSAARICLNSRSIGRSLRPVLPCIVRPTTL
jgi:hypothetical protein